MTPLQNQGKGPVVFVPFMGNYGGIERNLIALSYWFHKRGKTATVLCFSCLFDFQSYSDHPIKLVCLTDSKNPWTRAKLLSEFLDKDYRETGLLPLLFGVKAAFYMGIRCKSPFALHYTDPPSLLSERRANGLIWAMRRAGADYFTDRGVQRSRVFVTMTQRNADELEQIHRRRPLVIHQGGLPPAQPTFIRESKAPRDALRVLSVCRLEESKRLDWIIAGVSRFNSSQITSGVRAVAVFVGEGSMRSTLEEQSRINPEIKVTGGLSAEELEAEFAEAALFAVPARQGYGLPVLEALYRGIPVVVHRDSGVCEALEDEQLAVVADGNSDDFAQSLCQALHRVTKDDFPPTPSSRLPTEETWADELAKICRWTV